MLMGVQGPGCRRGFRLSSGEVCGAATRPAQTAPAGAEARACAGKRRPAAPQTSLGRPDASLAPSPTQPPGKVKAGETRPLPLIGRPHLPSALAREGVGDLVGEARLLHCPLCGRRTLRGRLPTAAGPSLVGVLRPESVREAVEEEGMDELDGPDE